MTRNQSIAFLAALTYAGSVTRAGAIIDLRPTPPGGYAPNTIIELDIFLLDSGNPEGDITFHSIALDFADTTGTLRFPGPDKMSNTPDDKMFCWDPPMPFLSFSQPSLPRPFWSTTAMFPNPSFAFTLPNEGEVRLGDIVVSVGTLGGLLDVLNADATEFDRGAIAVADVDGSILSWEAQEADLTGGRLQFIVPEPATISLCAAALLGLAARSLHHAPENK